jgi:excisionase family DNA binding protein
VAEKYLTDREVAELLGCSIQRLRNDRHQGKGLPFYRFGRSIRYAESEVVEYMRLHRVEPEGSGR